jgi:hypothetical protein
MLFLLVCTNLLFQSVLSYIEVACFAESQVLYMNIYILPALVHSD